jgi:hypothetical protein
LESRVHTSPPEIPRKKNDGFTDHGGFRNTMEEGVAGEEFPGIAGGDGIRSGKNVREREETAGQPACMGEE